VTQWEEGVAGILKGSFIDSGKLVTTGESTSKPRTLALKKMKWGEGGLYDELKDILQR